MDSLQFCYWLQGVMEVADPKILDERQVQTIKDHLKLVFQKVTPDRNSISDLAKTIKELPKISPVGGRGILDSPSICCDKTVVASNPNPHQTYCASDPRTQRMCDTTIGFKTAKDCVDNDGFTDTILNVENLINFNGPQPSC